MSDTPEKKIKDFVKKSIRNQFGTEAWEYSPVPMGLGKKGVPDLLYCIKGLFVAIECKADPTKQPTSLQKIQLEQIENAGGLSLVVNDKSGTFINKINVFLQQNGKCMLF